MLSVIGDWLLVGAVVVREVVGEGCQHSCTRRRSAIQLARQRFVVNPLIRSNILSIFSQVCRLDAVLSVN